MTKHAIVRSCFYFFLAILVAPLLPSLIAQGESLADEAAPAEAELAAEQAGSEGSTETKLEDLPLRLTAVADGKKHRWDPLNNGVLNTGTACFDGAMRLTQGREEFEVEEVWEDPVNATYRMKGTLAGLKVERRILIDREIGAARYLDIFYNTSDDDLDLTLSYKNSLSFAAENVYTSRGREILNKLGSRDFGVAIEAPAGAGHPGVMMVLAHERSGGKPKVMVSEDRESIEFDYPVTVKAGQKAAILIWIAQEEFQGADGLEERFAPIYENRRLVGPAVDESQLELLVNFPANYEDVTGGADYLVAVNQLSDRLQLEREADVDKMRVENGSVLTGEATGEIILVASPFGDLEVHKARVAVLEGGSGSGRSHKVYLRDGSVYSGAVSVEGLGLKGGFEVSLDMGQLDYLFYRLGDSDGEFPEGTDVFVRLHTGDVIPIAGAQALELGLVSPWGQVDVAMSEIEWMRYVKEPSPRHRISLSDGSLLTVFLDPREIKVVVEGAGELSFQATELGAMWGAEVELPKDFSQAESVSEITEIPKSMATGACLLSGSNLIAGELAGEALHVLTGATVTKVRVADVVRMSRAGEELEQVPVFEIELGSGDRITGMLQERSLEVRSGERSWRVPVQHFLATSASGAPPESGGEGVADPHASESDQATSRVSGRRVVPPPTVEKP